MTAKSWADSNDGHKHNTQRPEQLHDCKRQRATPPSDWIPALQSGGMGDVFEDHFSNDSSFEKQKCQFWEQPKFRKMAKTLNREGIYFSHLNLPSNGQAEVFLTGL